jgi:glutamine synthetase
MKELNEELWKLGIMSKTEHNEAAPAQHELAPIYCNTNLATDHNQLIMDVMKKVAERCNMACLLHEKPFESVSGSGKHNNWSLSTDTGINLLEPGSSPHENAQFLLFLCAVIKAVDEHQDLLRISASSAGNDNRLGASEAPPAVISMFLGTELTEILEAIEKGSAYQGKEKVDMEIGVHTLPKFPRDNTDRNRTSPFAFTGNKFEFRMPGSNMSISCPNMILNTITADVLMEFADKLEAAEDFNAELNLLIRDTIKNHKRIIFNGNGYTDEWLDEAQKRGLLNLPTTPDALPHFIKEKNVELFAKHHIFTKAELHSRYEILLETYCKVVHIEANTMLEMAKKDIMPAVMKYIKFISETVASLKIALPEADRSAEEEILTKMTNSAGAFYKMTGKLESDISAIKEKNVPLQKACYLRDVIIKDMAELRQIADGMEEIMPSEYYPYPNYGDMLFSVI